MGRYAYTEEQNAWLAERFATTPNRQLAEEFAERFGERVTATAMNSWGGNHHMRKEPWVRGAANRKYTDEQLDFLREVIPGRTYREVSDLFAERYGAALTRSMVANVRHKLGVLCGVNSGCFRKGHAPANKGRPWSEWMSEAGAERSRATQFRKGQLSGIAAERDYALLGERVTRDGYREVRVDPRGQRHTMDRWIPLGAFNWMAANGREWPEGCKCVHIDRDVTNDSADNIEPVPNELWPMLCGAIPGQLEWHDRETLRTAILYARVTRARTESERRARIAAGRPRRGDLPETD